MLTPETILQNRYLVMNLLAQGGMGAVYKAKDQRLGNTVALKETFFNDDNLSNAFEREARLLADLRHSALPVVSDHFKEGDGQFLVMQFIPGDDLAVLLEREKKPFPLRDVLNWADRLLDALDYLHTHEPQIIHRDIKPQNLKLTQRGEIVLLDFGLAKGAAHGMTNVNSNQSIHGYTPIYAPLEQIQGSGTEPRSDLYSLAATLYHLLTGVSPTDALARAEAILDGKPDPLVPLNRLNPQIPAAVNNVLMRAMSMSREQRSPNASQMRLALQEAMPMSAPLINSVPSFASSTVVGGSPTQPNQKSQKPMSPAQSTKVFSTVNSASSQANVPTVVAPSTSRRTVNSNTRSPSTMYQGAQPYVYETEQSKPKQNLYILGALLVLVATIAFVVITHSNPDKTNPPLTQPTSSSGATSNQSNGGAQSEPTRAGASSSEREREPSYTVTPSTTASQPTDSQPKEKPASETAQEPAASETPQTAAPASIQTSGGARTPSMFKQGDGKLPTPDPPAQSPPKQEELRPAQPTPSQPQMAPPPPPPPPPEMEHRPPQPRPGRPPV